MALLRHDRPRALDPFTRLLERTPVWWPFDPDELIRVDEFRDGDDWVIRADMPGIDPDKDVEVTVADGMLHLRAQRHSEDTSQTRDYYRQEVRYGAFARDLPLPDACAADADADAVTATYTNGILEIRAPAPPAAEEKQSHRINVAKG